MQALRKAVGWALILTVVSVVGTFAAVVMIELPIVRYVIAAVAALYAMAATGVYLLDTART